MSTYCITYDLNKPGQNYAGVYEAIKKLGAWWHYLDSTWLVSTSLSAEQIWTRLDAVIDRSDRILVIRVCGDRQGWLDEEAWDWIRQHVSNC